MTVTTTSAVAAEIGTPYCYLGWLQINVLKGSSYLSSSWNYRSNPSHPAQICQWKKNDKRKKSNNSDKF
jgi:hypothetical protein